MENSCTEPQKKKSISSQNNPVPLFDVSGLGNPLVDILVNVDNTFLKTNGLNKGIMHLIEKNQKDQLINQLKGKSAVTEAGGSCPNTIATLSLMGTRTALAGGVGKDYYGKIFEEKIKEKNITSFLSKKESDTGVCTVLITPDKERTMNTYLGACRSYTKEDISPDMIEKSRFFYFTGYMLDTDNQKTAITHALDIAKRAGVKIVFDIADPFAVERHRKNFLRIIEETADIIFANAQEAHLLQGTQSNYDNNIYNATLQLGRLCEIAVIKDGAHDTHVYNSGDIMKIPSFQSRVQDTTGAGDNFAAGFLYGLIKDYPLEQCGRIASYVASKTIEKIGAQAPADIGELVEKMIEKGIE